MDGHFLHAKRLTTSPVRQQCRLANGCGREALEPGIVDRCGREQLDEQDDHHQLADRPAHAPATSLPWRQRQIPGHLDHQTRGQNHEDMLDEVQCVRRRPRKSLHGLCDDRDLQRHPDSEGDQRGPQQPLAGVPGERTRTSRDHQPQRRNHETTAACLTTRAPKRSRARANLPCPRDVDEVRCARPPIRSASISASCSLE